LRGYLTSHFILKGYSVLGADVSPSALEGGRAAFGDHFAMADSEAVRSRSPYDVIYHTGMIGFVANPLELTKTLLGMMNLEESCCSTRRMWKAARCRDNSGSTLRPLQMWLRCSNPASGGASSVPSAMFRKRLRSPTKIEAPRSRCDESVDETGGGPDRWTETNLRQSPG